MCIAGTLRRMFYCCLQINLQLKNRDLVVSNPPSTDEPFGSKSRLQYTA